MTEKACPAENTHVAPEYAIFAKKNRVVGDASVEAPVDASRAVTVLTVEELFCTPVGTPAPADARASGRGVLPGLRPSRRGSRK